MKKKLIVKIVLILAVTVVSVYMLGAAVLFKPAYNDTICNDLRISIEGKFKLVNSTEVRDLLVENNLLPIGKAAPAIDEEEIEKCLENNPLVDKAECYFLPNTNTLQIEIRLKEPLFVVLGNESYYVDVDHSLLPLSERTAAYLPVVTGRVTRSMAKEGLYDFLYFVNNDDFWNAQIEQVHVRNDLKVELVPRVGSTIIKLGSLDKYKDKLERVRLLYDQAFKSMGWNNYSMLNLEYDDQIVCTKVKP